MNENLKNFLEYASQNEDVKQKLDALKDETDKDAAVRKIIEIAKKAGFELSADDFTQKSGELSDDELDAVAGGNKCVCVLGGGGTYLDPFNTIYGKIAENLTCACVAAGVGEIKYINKSTLETEKFSRCVCAAYGEGDDVGLNIKS